MRSPGKRERGLTGLKVKNQVLPGVYKRRQLVTHALMNIDGLAMMDVAALDPSCVDSIDAATRHGANGTISYMAIRPISIQFLHAAT